MTAARLVRTYSSTTTKTDSTSITEVWSMQWSGASTYKWPPA
ncbi:hypothetical protein ACFXGR_43905 [Streptomyces mirabilis]